MTDNTNPALDPLDPARPFDPDATPLPGFETIHTGIAVLHDCWAGTADEVRHTAIVEIHDEDRVYQGVRYRGRRCDGTHIEWTVPS